VPPVTAVYDACVLYPAPVRDLLVHLAVLDVVRARWTDAIHDEWIRGVLADRPDLTRVQLERTRALMNANVRDCLVTGYEDIIPTLPLPDPDDRHVLAAAVHGGAEVIVTFNLADFPAAALAPFNVAAVHPDEFASRLLAEEPARVCEAARRQRANLKNPPKTVDEFLSTLEQCRLALTAAGRTAQLPVRLGTTFFCSPNRRAFRSPAGCPSTPRRCRRCRGSGRAATRGLPPASRCAGGRSGL
jgi:hypothetical protein